jgi:hypothetical protein
MKNFSHSASLSQPQRPSPASQQVEFVSDERPVLDQLVFVQHTRRRPILSKHPRGHLPPVVAGKRCEP